MFKQLMIALGTQWNGSEPWKEIERKASEDIAYPESCRAALLILENGFAMGEVNETHIKMRITSKGLYYYGQLTEAESHGRALQRPSARSWAELHHLQGCTHGLRIAFGRERNRATRLVELAEAELATERAIEDAEGGLC